MNRKMIIIERWEERIVNITEVVLADDENNTIDGENILEEHIETVEGGDKDILSIEEAIKKYNGMQDCIKEAVNRLKKDNNFYDENDLKRLFELAKDTSGETLKEYENLLEQMYGDFTPPHVRDGLINCKTYDEFRDHLNEFIYTVDYNKVPLYIGDKVYSEEDPTISGKVMKIYPEFDEVDIHHSDAHQGPVVDTFHIKNHKLVKV